MTSYDWPGVSVNGSHPGIRMTDAQLAQVVGDQFGRENGPTAIAIILAESGGDAYAKNPTTNPNYFGLWQISKSAHPDLIKPYTPGASDTDNPFDPDANTRMALSVFKASGNKFTAWQTYNHGTYTAFLDRGKKASDGLARTGAEVDAKNPGPRTSSTIDKAITTGTNTVKDVAQALNPAQWLAFAVNALINSGIFILAVVLLILGIWLLLPKTVKNELPNIPVPV